MKCSLPPSFIQPFNKLKRIKLSKNTFKKKNSMLHLFQEEAGQKAKKAASFAAFAPPFAKKRGARAPCTPPPPVTG